MTVRQPFWKHVTVSTAPSTKSEVIFNIKSVFIHIAFPDLIKRKTTSVNTSEQIRKTILSDMKNYDILNVNLVVKLTQIIPVFAHSFAPLVDANSSTDLEIRLGETKFVSSRDWPDRYPNSLNDLYTLRAPVGSSLNVTLLYFLLETDCYDQFYIYEGMRAITIQHLFLTFCGII